MTDQAHKDSEIEKKSPGGAEEHYNEHKEHPAPSEEAILEKNNKGAGQALKWIIPLCVVILFIIYFLVRNK